jgi:hypothetical protein
MTTDSNFSYYYNQKVGQSPWRNNLIYTSLISEDKKIFIKWYHNDTEYHQGKNEVVDPRLMDEKWQREVYYIQLVKSKYPNIVPDILDIDFLNKKIFLKIDGVDLWQHSLDRNECSLDNVVSDWQDQMLNIFQCHKEMNLYKFSLHPSSYFPIDGKLKNINYFFTHSSQEKTIKVNDFLSHVSYGRREILKPITDNYGYNWEDDIPLNIMQLIVIECFADQYPKDFIKKALDLFS